MAWFQLVDLRGEAFNNTTPDQVPLNDNNNVASFRTAVKRLYEDSHLHGIAASDLIVYESQAAFAAEQPLELDAMIEKRGGKLRNSLLVKVPNLTRKRKLSEESILDQLEALQVAEVEFQLDALSDKQESENPIVMTPGLHTFWKESGDFPSSYFVRKEEVVFWQVVKGLLPTVGKKRIVMVGSPGVGKSCFLMLVGFYMACVEKKKYDAKHDDPSHVVVLPAWQRDDLEQYARLTEWVISTGFRKTKNLKDSTWPKLVKEQYFYSGGSLREFCKTREALEEQVEKDCGKVGNAQAYQLVYTYGGDRSNDQVDRVRRHYITDPKNEEHYTKSRYWKVSVDSGYALKLLGRHVSMEKQLEVFKYAESIGAGFLGTAYELLLHHAVHEAYAKKTPVVLKMKKGSYYERIEICVPHVECCGENEDECYICLAKLSERTYWHPDYPFFPFIDAVVMCEAFKSGSNRPEMIVAYIQATIRNEKTFKPHRLRELNEAMNKNPNIVDVNRAFVVVGPDSTICETFTLRDAPNPEDFLTMVSCFDPHEFERQ
ncbi:hypothetical protein BBO99_00009860 [Phytophthora kernoviae]|uniref:Crinkler effector protein N-terminal domain-containing protein n=2 Tax=Phytophthora kernoviae TaxID=325452 RepID=A0A421EU58_9STRA|nr:hypothetical protein G195_011266 [Phytophthora kernoviae 00238/432]KAG2502439.1 hypothetical protein JM16_009802 [Phytophthora kernoviae]KAG2502984.1 hypothetical protein JM18_009698 [Phytophthora kernoviae]RLN02406.1 hypothetical protein BBI17_009915 [Phytophthora kernoviae]RLN72351.1 hypothetical protein BBO99_00009860 [Phytophthora kernoviae]